MLSQTLTLKTNLFPETSRKIITILTAIIGNDDDQTVDEYILCFMTSIFPPSVNPLVKFNYAQFLADNIHLQ
jgi:hypothetical protein